MCVKPSGERFNTLLRTVIGCLSRKRRTGSRRKLGIADLLACQPLGFGSAPERLISAPLGFGSAPERLSSAPLGFGSAPLGLLGAFAGAFARFMVMICTAFAVLLEIIDLGGQFFDQAAQLRGFVDNTVEHLVRNFHVFTPVTW